MCIVLCVEQYSFGGVDTMYVHITSILCTAHSVEQYMWSMKWTLHCAQVHCAQCKYMWSVERTLHYAQVHYAGCTVWSNMSLVEWRHSTSAQQQQPPQCDASNNILPIITIFTIIRISMTIIPSKYCAGTVFKNKNVFKFAHHPRPSHL